ncbi:MAG: hypothetical protein QHC67_17830 [Sphingobium sp.]|uniref:hypothetical protein n=1 Tax=Sphingobium sp. TaxID=1912891 RepID=UPI0029BD9992|nr:hypothetical protein [Sphingobium sp.]MDX3911644.1 hypothetical protein [Sphingobium sp.]
MGRISDTQRLKAAKHGVIWLCLMAEIYLAHRLNAFQLALDKTAFPLMRFSAVPVLGVVTLWAIYTVGLIFQKRAITSWWQPHGGTDLSDLSWDEVYGLVAFDEKLDPLRVSKRVRWKWWIRSLRMQVPIYLAICSLALSIFDLLQNPKPRPFLLEGSSFMGDTPLAKPVAALIGNPTAYLALIVGLATIFFTFRQIRAKVRADSRQAWILKARELLGDVVASIDAHKERIAANDSDNATELWNTLNPKRLELELMLNPSEKDHRLLMYLIQHFSAWREPPVIPQDAKILKDIIADETPTTERLQEWNAILNATDRAALVSYILRLSHVVLKREWERVKLIQ